MKTTRYDGSPERRVLVGLLTSAPVCAAVAREWADAEEPFPSPYANLVASWCVGYYQSYGRAPGRDVASLFSAWANQGGRDQALAALVGEFLESVSDEYDLAGEVNADHLIDQAGRLFRRTRLRRLAEAVAADLDAGADAALDRAERRVENHTRVTIGDKAHHGFFADEYEVKSAFDREEADLLVEYPGALGTFLGNTFSRGRFVSFLGIDKSGKSRWLRDLAYRAVAGRKRVAYFEAGDHDLKQFQVALAARVMNRPTVSPDGRWPHVYDYPKSLAVGRAKAGGGRREASVTFSRRTAERPSGQEAWDAVQEFRKHLLRSRQEYLSVRADPAGTLRMATVRADLKQMEREGYVPDVVCIDYSDILAPPRHDLDAREAIDENWKQLRRVAAEFRCLVVTATQADAKGYDRYWLDRSNFSDNKKKNAHPHAILGLNMTDEEKDMQVTRVNFVVRREGAFSQRKGVFCAGCWAVGNPCVRTSL